MMRIGHLEFPFPVVQAALSGYSDRPMRKIARLCGAPYTVHEVVLDKYVLQEGKRQRRAIAVDEDDHPVGGQLLGSEPDQFARAARGLAQAGFDVIDINFGCPVPKVLGRCRGGFLLSQPETALEIVRRVRDAVPVGKPVTVKMRRGLDDDARSSDCFYKILDGAFAAGVAAITVHPRTVRQRYDGPSRWEFLAQLKRHAGNKTVLGSGDLFTPQDAVRMIKQTGVDGVTVARGAIGNPWIFREARALWEGCHLPDPPSIFEQRAVLLEHGRLALQQYGSKRGAKTMRKFGIKYALLHPSSEAVRKAFVALSNWLDWNEVVQTFYSADGPGRRATQAGAPEPSPKSTRHGTPSE